MGRCLSCLKSKEREVASLPEATELIYRQRIPIVRPPNHTQSPSEDATIQLKAAETVFSQTIRFQGRRLLVSGTIHTVCSLPGHCLESQEAAGVESCVVEGRREGVLVGLFTGHGKEGKYAAQLCRETCLTGFSQSKRQSDPEKFLESVVPLRTALLLLFTSPAQLTLASVGDSRCLLSSSQPETNPPVDPKPLRGSALRNITNFSNTRAIPLSVPLFPVQLAYDQSPGYPEELVRIFKAGGIVSQQANSQGVKAGPYKVFRGKGQEPVLTVSRSIGNLEGSKLGVIAEPIVTEYALKWDSDQFIVLASKGIWEVMSNLDAVKFVEKYRYHCLTSSLQQNSAEITCSNATIAQLLCEEARLRLMLAGEAEELAENITCIVIEFPPKEKAPLLTSGLEELAMVTETGSIAKNTSKAGS